MVADISNSILVRKVCRVNIIILLQCCQRSQKPSSNRFAPTRYVPAHSLTLSLSRLLLVLPPEVSQILTKTKTPSERAPLIRITGKDRPIQDNMSTLLAPIFNLNVRYRVTPKELHLQFSKTPILANFGELPFGDIPEPLKFVRPFRK